jgi:hypothetical protein
MPQIDPARRARDATLRPPGPIRSVSFPFGVAMNSLLLFDVPPAPSSLTSVAPDFTSLEPWLLIGTGIAAGWVWGRYWHLHKDEQQQGARSNTSKQ